MALTKDQSLRDLIVLALGRLGGSGRRADVLAEMQRLWGGNFTAEDREQRLSRLPRVEEKWRNNASYERDHMKHERLLVDRADGVWELDRPGWDHLRRLSGIPDSAAAPSVTASNLLKRFAPKDSSDYLAHVAGRVLKKSRDHEALVRDYGRWAEVRGFRPFTLHPRDLVLEHSGDEWLVEAKVLYDGNVAEAARAAVGQLFDYRHFFYLMHGLALPSLLGLFSEPIGGAYVNLLESLSIASVWRSAGSWAGSSSAIAGSLAAGP